MVSRYIRVFYFLLITCGLLVAQDGRIRVAVYDDTGGNEILHILNAKVIDRAHWNRGMGDVILDMTNEGKEFFEIHEDTVTIAYRQGPLLAPDDKPGLEAYQSLATYQTEIVKNDALPGVMIGKTAIATGTFEKGRVICFSPHPERSESLQPWIARAATWAARKE